MTKRFIRNKCIQDSWILLIIIGDNVTIYITKLQFSKWGSFSPFSSLVILLLVLQSNFIVSGIKSLILYPVLISNVNLFTVLFTYIFIKNYQFFLHVLFFKYTQNNLEYLIQNMICQVIQIYHSTSWYYKFIVFNLFYICSIIVNAKIW